MARPDTPASGAGITAVDGCQTRPLRADARRNRDRVLEAARTAFAAEGSDVPLDEIARRAGVGAGTVYRHFATKEALFEAVVFDRIGELVEEARALSDDPDPGRAFSSFVERLGREGARKARPRRSACRRRNPPTTRRGADRPSAHWGPGGIVATRPGRWCRAKRYQRRRRGGCFDGGRLCDLSLTSG